MLGSLRVLLVGCGSIAGRISLALSRLQIQLLVLVEPKDFKAESHLTHECSPRDAGLRKVTVMGRRCKELSPGTHVLTFDGSVQELPLEVLLDVDVVIMATDNLAAEVAVGELCTRLSKPLIHAAVHGDSLTAQVRSYGNTSADRPCPACGFGAEEIEQWNRETRFSCEGDALASPSPQLAAQSTRSTASLCSLGADLAVNQFLRMTLKLGAPVQDSALEYNGFTHRSVISPLRRNPACRCEHLPGTVICLCDPLGVHTPRRLLELAGAAPEEANALLELDGFRYVEVGACACQEPVPVHRFLKAGAALQSVCAACGSSVLPLEFYTHRAVTQGRLGAQAEVPLKRMGAGAARSALIRTHSRVVVLNHKPKELP
jgi:molybdopterin/thiamine biosynthesis adenylyltransferase